MITIISDSHIPGRADQISDPIWEKIEGAEIVVHAGDYARKETFNAVEEYSKKFYGVKGNCDFFEADNLEQSKKFEYEGVEIGVYHGTGISPRGHKPTLEKIAEDDLGVNILIHGHTHKEDINKVGSTLLLNPGSCTGVGGGRTRSSRPTMLELQIEGSKIEAIIYEVKDNKLSRKESKSYDVKDIKKE